MYLAFEDVKDFETSEFVEKNFSSNTYSSRFASDNESSQSDNINLDVTANTLVDKDQVWVPVEHGN